MVEFIPINLDIHKSLLVEMNEEYLSWIAREMKKKYDLDIFNVGSNNQLNKIEQQAIIRDYSKGSVEKLTSYMPPEGIYYILQINKKVAGMGALRKLNRSIGEIKRMYIRPEYRGKGFGKVLLQQILKKLRSLDCQQFDLKQGSL